MNWYHGQPAEDVLVAGWWHRMDADGDLERIFPSDGRAMAHLFGLIVPPKVCAYEFDAEGIWFAMWFDALIHGLCAGLWIRRDYRHGRRGRLAAQTFAGLADAVLAKTPVLVGLTKQPSLLRIHRQFGYTVVGEIPGLWDGEAAIIVALTRERLHAALARRRVAQPAVEPAGV